MQKSPLPPPQLVIFDLDNTLYHAENGLFAQMDDNINRFICEHLETSWQEADTLRLRYWKQYGTTLTGLMKHHGITPEPFLHAAHNLEIDQSLNAAPELNDLLTQCSTRKIIHTNGTVEHAERVLLRLGILDHFATIYDIRFNHYQPKPCSTTLALLLEQEQVNASATLVIDDLADNLRAAASIGCQTAWINGDNSPDQPFDYHDPTIVALMHRLLLKYDKHIPDPSSISHKENTYQMSMQNSVLERYSEGAKQREATLCCPVDYDTSLLKLLPQEIIDRDYGCGDPSRYVQQGDTVLDLGSGGGKICYMAAQLVGEEGSVIGVDMNDDMLALARSHQATMADKLGGDRVSFIKGYIQDLALDLSATNQWLSEHPITDHEGVAALTRFQNQQKKEQPLVADQSIDLIISNCVLNLVDASDKPAMFDDIFRVLRPGGRVAISDIVSDQIVPQSLMDDPELWSGCISGAMEESAFIQAFADAGLTGVRIDKWDAAPWQVVEGIEFRSVTVTAYKPTISTSSSAHDHAVIYRGPFAHLTTDSGLHFVRGQRTPVTTALFNTLAHAHYHNDFITIDPDNTDNPDACCSTSGCC